VAVTLAMWGVVGLAAEALGLVNKF